MISPLNRELAISPQGCKVREPLDTKGSQSALTSGFNYIEINETTDCTKKEIFTCPSSCGELLLFTYLRWF